MEKPANGQLSPATAELLAAGRMLLQDLEGELAVGLVGHDLAAVASEALEAGDPNGSTPSMITLLQGLPADPCLSALAGLCQAATPDVILFARSAWGRELAPRLAGRLGAGLLQDCLEVSIEPGSGCLTGGTAGVRRQFPGPRTVCCLAANGGPAFAGIRTAATGPEPARRDRCPAGRPRRRAVARAGGAARPARAWRHPLDGSPRRHFRGPRPERPGALPRSGRVGRHASGPRSAPPAPRWTPDGFPAIGRLG